MIRIAIALAATSLGAVSGYSAELPLKKVVLSTSGLGQFTYAGQGQPGSTIDLSVRLDQVDDILKTLTVFDKEGGVGAVTLAGKTPLSELFRDLPFGPDALQAPASLLNALVGAEVEIEGQVSAKGRVFRVEDEISQLPNNGGAVKRHRITLLTEKGLVQAILEELSSLRFTDAQARSQIDRALSGLAQNRAKERRTISINLLGQAARDVGFSYVVAAPVWKTSYRLVVPKEGGKARLQGWGVLENLTGSDWKDVDLSLVSGNPVALKQSLYSAFYVDRPEVPISIAQRVVPNSDDSDAKGQMRFGAGNKFALEKRQMPAAAPKDQNMAYQAFDGGRAIAGKPAMEEEPFGTSALAATSEDGATQVVFHFPVPLSLAAGSTMMIPFVDREVPVTRTWLYQPDVNEKRPLAAIRIGNEGESALPPGLVTSFDKADGSISYAGDAQLPLLPRASFKFITFALDTKTDIRRTSQPYRETRFGKAVNGVMTVTRKSRWRIDYEVTSPPDEDRDVIIDELRQDGWTPTAEMKDIEETPSRLRMKISAPKGKTTKAALIREHIDQEQIRLDELEPERILATISGLENESASVKEAVAKLSVIIGDMNKANAQRERIEKEREAITQDQQRIRSNLSSVGQSSDLGRRYLDALRNQEDRLTALAQDNKSIDAKLEQAREAAEAVAKQLTL